MGSPFGRSLSEPYRSATRSVDADLVARHLRAGCRGPVLRPSDPAYETARRIWNGMVDRRPALIARCTSTDDVVAAVGAAREQNMSVAVRGGGHNVAGTAVCDDGLMLDLSLMKRIDIDPMGLVARVQPGVLWGELDGATQRFGLVVPGGIVSHTGVSGLTLGGGIGWLMRRFGLTCDNLLSTEVVTAGGRRIRSSLADHADLFWGLRGGGGNFGVVTEFEFRLQPLDPPVLAGLMLFPVSRAREVLRAYREFAAAAPDALTTILSLRRAPSLAEIPQHLHGVPVLNIGVCFAGPVAEGEVAVRPLKDLGPLVDLVRPTQYSSHQSLLDRSVPHGLRYYWKAEYLHDLTDAAIDILTRRAWTAPSPMSYTIIFQMGGAVSRVPEEDTAFGHRQVGYAANINSVWSEAGNDASQIAWAREYWEELRLVGTGGVYVNFLDNEGESRVEAAYSADQFRRLVNLKAKYDPTNFFRMNQNIPPAVRTG